MTTDMNVESRISQVHTTHVDKFPLLSRTPVTSMRRFYTYLCCEQSICQLLQKQSSLGERYFLFG